MNIAFKISHFINGLVLVPSQALAKLLLRNELRNEREMQSVLHNKNAEYYKKISILEEENAIFHHRFRRIKYLLNAPTCKNALTTIEVTSKGVEVLVQTQSNDHNGDIQIHVYDLDTFRHNESHELYILGKIRGKELLLVDIVGGRGEGHGVVAMKKILDIATNEDIEKVYGELAPVHFSHRNRQISFYKKMGFNIKLSRDRREGYVEYFL